MGGPVDFEQVLGNSVNVPQAMSAFASPMRLAAGGAAFGMQGRGQLRPRNYGGAGFSLNESADPREAWGQNLEEGIYNKGESIPSQLLAALFGSPDAAPWLLNRGWLPRGAPGGLGLMSYAGDAGAPETRQQTLADRITARTLEPSAAEIANRWADVAFPMARHR